MVSEFRDNLQMTQGAEVAVSKPHNVIRRLCGIFVAMRSAGSYRVVMPLVDVN
jgi:hypothetical protein